MDEMFTVILLELSICHLGMMKSKNQMGNRLSPADSSPGYITAPDKSGFLSPTW
jgi:hypothetical protein